MTAMFVVIFMDQWLKEKNHTSSLLGLGISFLCLLVFRTGLFYDSDHDFDYRLIDIIAQKAWYPGSKKLLATSFRQMCFLKKWSSNKKHRRFANMTLAQQIMHYRTLCYLVQWLHVSCLFLYFVKTGKLLSSFNMLENFFHPQFSACWSFTVWEM